MALARFGRLDGAVFNAAVTAGSIDPERVLVVGDSPLIIRDVVVATLTTLTTDPLYKYELSFSASRW